MADSPRTTVATLDELTAAALKLSRPERIQLIEALRANEPMDLSPEWKVEIQRRIDDLDSGSEQGIPWKEVKGKLDERLAAARSRR